VYCKPLAIKEGKIDYAIAVLSVATHEADSRLGDILDDIRAQRPLKQSFDAAVDRFTAELTAELARDQEDKDGESDDETTT
jgi:hypothetical protein